VRGFEYALSNPARTRSSDLMSSYGRRFAGRCWEDAGHRRRHLGGAGTLRGLRLFP